MAGLRKIADRSVDHFIFDPPYGERTHAKGKRYKRGEIVDHVIKYKPMTAANMRAVSKQIVRCCRRWIVLTCDSDSPHLWRKALEDAGAEFVRHGIFVKDDAQPQMSGDRPGIGFECVVICHAPRESGPLRWNGGGRCARWHATSDVKQPTRYGVRRDLIVDGQKPLSLMRAIVSDFTDPGELVCDPYSGGGTTAVACQELGRRFLGWEQERETYDKASARIKEAGKQQPLPLSRAKATQLQLGG
jgi:site-specific DNA-methyltransferase (adenine-specific)